MTRRRNENFGLQVIVHGQELPKVDHNGQTFIEGLNGAEFKLRLTNYTDKRILIVPTIDGLSVMDGKAGSASSGGYVVDANQSSEIPGWRLGTNAVASFKFGALPASYAAQMDKPQNIGVIGAVAYAERYQPPPAYVEESFAFRGGGFESTRGGGATRGATAKGLGTEFGRQQEFHTTSVVFERGEQLGMLTLRYDNRAGLLAAGVPANQLEDQPTQYQTTSGNPRLTEANPFPGDGCPRPKNWGG